ncbi:MAG: fatty acid desaturase [Bryobacteraceae bacterium]
MLDKIENRPYSWGVETIVLPQPKYRFGAVLFFALLHASIVAAFWVPPTASLVMWFVATYSIRMFGITAGYHRYFGHRSYRLGRVSQFVMASLAQSSAQKGVLWWAAHHRQHHRESDREHDVHSPSRRGFWWAHVGWVLSNDFDEYDPRAVHEFLTFPEIRWIDKHHWVPTVVFGAMVLLWGGWPAFVWGYLFSTVVLYHCTFAINSMAHLWGSRRFDTPDDSRNNALLALITFGEGWHNNHHYSPGSCRQGRYWWEIDITFMLLLTLSWIGIVRDLRPFRGSVSSRAMHIVPAKAA